MNKSAKEMFEELGYEKERIYIDGWLNQIVYQIRMKNDRKFKKIIFQYDEKVVDFLEYTSINMKELKAINKQVEELGWNNE